jgi:SAM-dependent methyltransferase
MQRTLRFYVSDFDANALLGMYPMMLLGTSHWQKLLGGALRRRLLDIGAGAGDVTSALAPLFEEIHAVEVSRGMVRRLRKRGFNPRALLRSAMQALAPHGRLVIALALPYRPFYYDGASTPAPSEHLTCSGTFFEEQVEVLVERELEPLGRAVERWARAPYLSAGDKDRPLYELDDVILVLQRG